MIRGRAEWTVRELKEGRKMRRKCWSPDVSIVLVVPDVNSETQFEPMLIQGWSDDSAHYALDAEDLLARDWEHAD